MSELVAEKLREDWSPEQIAGWLKLEFGDDQTRRVSHETIYLSLFIQARGALKHELVAHLRRAGAVRRPRGAKPSNQRAAFILGAPSIRERPAEVEDRAIPGHWEGDLIAGAANTHLAMNQTKQDTILHDTIVLRGPNLAKQRGAKRLPFD